MEHFILVSFIRFIYLSFFINNFFSYDTVSLNMDCLNKFIFYSKK